MTPVSLPSFELLPNELLDEIISCLATSPPSAARLHQPPSARISRSDDRPLKNLARASSQILEVVRPRLFAHACFDLENVPEFLSFISTSNLGRYVTSIVVHSRPFMKQAADPFWWRQVLACLDPLGVTVVAPPSSIGTMLGAEIFEGDSWAFDVPLQILHLKKNPQNVALGQLPSLEKCSSLLEARDWSSMVFNESSSIKAYTHYEYFLFQSPSLFTTWGSIASLRSREARAALSVRFNNLTSFSFVAVFPFYNHVKLVLNAIELMVNLRSLSIQLAPCEGDKVTEIEQKGSMDPSDPWMEIATGYSLIAHLVKDLGEKKRLVQFMARDYSFDALRPELSAILSEVLDDTDWVHDGDGTWNRRVRNSSEPFNEVLPLVDV
ncbi:F-box domain protein [Aspergillus affinis]|uniref:F-box domain protein n=1 Tax=Aspergillus affinis TaxID=1070780 RepID=UPI0022FE6DB7|nr:uncharacterized protein KD926_007900 [Aspergillus affinis]KAI9045485.1 hypothetical protein KD926_007900 [Aspergillus affinis]